jgi:hypothetical protein
MALLRFPEDQVANSPQTNGWFSGEMPGHVYSFAAHLPVGQSACARAKLITPSLSQMPCLRILSSACGMETA